MTTAEGLPERDLDLRIGVTVRRVRLAARTAGEVVTRIRAGVGRDVSDLVFEVLDVIDLIDDEPPGYDEAVVIARDAESLMRLLTARNRWLGELRTHARVLALCPHCHAREAAVEMVTVALALSSPFPALVTPGGAFLAVPAIATPHGPGWRWGGVPRAARVKVELPSGRLAHEVDLGPRARAAVLRNADDVTGTARQEQWWETLAPPGHVPEPDHAYRHQGSVGFTAIIRMAAAIDALDDGAVTPDDVEELSVVDFLALDAAHHLVVNADQPRPDALAFTCEHCGGRYVPLLGG